MQALISAPEIRCKINDPELVQKFCMTKLSETGQGHLTIAVVNKLKETID
jgi:hypothetical protein